MTLYTYIRRPRLRLRLQSGSFLSFVYPLSSSTQLECCMPYESLIECVNCFTNSLADCLLFATALRIIKHAQLYPLLIKRGNGKSMEIPLSMVVFMGKSLEDFPLPSGRSSESLHTSRESQRLGEW